MLRTRDQQTDAAAVLAVPLQPGDDCATESLDPARGLLIALPICLVFWAAVAYALFY